jgi:hypothetical protein
MTPPKTAAGRFAERLLVGAVESIARGVAKAAESITADAKKALRKEASKIEMAEQTVKAWRETQLGEIDDGEYVDDTPPAARTGTYERKRS